MAGNEKEKRLSGDEAKRGVFKLIRSFFNQ